MAYREPKGRECSHKHGEKMFNIEQLLSFMKQHDASDLYITVGRQPSYKINGAVKSAGKKALTKEDVDALADSCMDEKQREEFYRKKEQNLALQYPEMGRFRVNLYRQKTHTA